MSEHKELISMTDYVLRDKSKIEGYKCQDYGQFSYNLLIDIENYAQFLKQKPELWMFVPCKNGEPMEEPEAEICCSGFGRIIECGCMGMPTNKEWYEYQEAKERVIFEGFEKVDLIEKGSFSLVVGYRKIGVWKSLCGYWKFSKSIKTLEDLTGLGLKYRSDKV